MQTITCEVLSTMSSQRRLVVMAILRAQGDYRTTVTDQELAHALRTTKAARR